MTLTTESDAFILEKTTDFTTLKLGDFNTEILSSEQKIYYLNQLKNS